MNYIPKEQFDNDLAIFSGMKEVGPSDFFYTRLSAKLEKLNKSNDMVLFTKPVWIICCLHLLLIANVMLLKTAPLSVDVDTNYNIEALASSYDQTISN